MSIDHIIRGFELKDCRGILERLITFTLVDYKWPGHREIIYSG